MVELVRKFLAVLAACGLFASITAYIASYRGTTWDSFVPWPAMILHLGIFALAIPMAFMESTLFYLNTPAWLWFSGGRRVDRGTFTWKGYAYGMPVWEESFYWKGFSQGKPKWTVPAIKLLALYSMIQFVVFMVQCRGARLQIEGGQYRLTSGRAVKVLTQSEYFALSSAMLRTFAAGWLFAYFLLTMYWWYPRNQPGKS
jgi:hypothetical protein